MKTITTLILLFLFLNMPAQSDIIKTDKGDLTITPVMHATMVLQWDGKTIYVDPYSGADKFEGFDDPDLILITDIHPDHLDKKTLSGLQTAGATFIVPQAVAEELGDIKSKEVIVINNGEEKTWGGIRFEAIPMYNLPESKDAFHPKGRGNGYVLNMDGKRIYISGDTEDTKEVRALKNIDVAFMCMNLPYTMGIDQAADAVLAFHPKIVYPFHYRNKDGSFSDLEEFKKMVNSKNPDIEVRLREWYPQ